MQSPAYASIERQIKLPNLHKIEKAKHIFKPITKQNKQDDDNQIIELPQKLQEKTNNLINELNETFYIFEDPQSFRFKFPESMFPAIHAGQKNKIRYEQKMITQQENTFKEKLSQDQLKQIKELGQFKVKSNIQYITLPYVWKINDRLYWGKKKVNYEWNKTLATIFGFFWTAKRYIQKQIPLQLSILKTFPQALFRLLFGGKSIKTVVPVNYERQLYKDFWNKILRQYYRQSDQWCSALWNYLYVYYDPELSRPIQYTSQYERKQNNHKRQLLRKDFQTLRDASNIKSTNILSIHTNFNIQWGKLKKKVIVQITDQINGGNNSSDQRAESQQELLLKQGDDNKDDKILQKLSQKKFTLYIHYLERELPKKLVPVQVINAIVFLLRLFNVISLKQANKTKQIAKRRVQVSQKIQKEHAIKSLFPPFFNKLRDAQMAIIEKTLNQELYLNLLKDKDFSSFLKDDLIGAYKQFLKFKFNKDILIEAKKRQLPQYHGPSRIFYSNYHLFPPYKVIYNGTMHSLKKISDDLTVDTTTNFWKLKLYWMRFKTWTINCIFYLFASALKGPLGLRCLWGIKDFQYQMNINYQTGEIYYETRSTVIGVFLEVIEGIKRSRQRFEQTPDLGLLGKNFSRIFNYLECYIFRFIFAGVIISLIGYPILIIVSSIITIVLVVTFWAWIPLIMVVTYLFNIIFKQFESQQIVYGVWSRSFPIIRIIIGIFRCLGIMLFSILNLILIAPIKTFFLFIFCSGQQLFRRFFDALMLLIFTKLGRTPSRDTLIARKISGPGMSKEFYMSINQEDVYVLVQANLQKIYLQQFNQLILNKIQKQGNCFRTIISLVLSPLGASYNNMSNQVIQNVNNLRTIYYQQYNIHINRYPDNPVNVRFTQEELDNYFQNTVSIVKRFVEKHKINGWIFEKYQLYEGMYDELTRSVWMGIFGCGQQIFEPLQKLDARFKLQDQYQNLSGFNASMKKQVGSVMRALEGDVSLNHRHKKLTPFKHNLLHRQLDTDQISQLYNIWVNNSIQFVSLDLNNVKSLFVPNLNIKEIIIVDDQARIRTIKNQTTIIDL